MITADGAPHADPSWFTPRHRRGCSCSLIAVASVTGQTLPFPVSPARARGTARDRTPLAPERIAGTPERRLRRRLTACPPSRTGRVSWLATRRPPACWARHVAAWVLDRRAAHLADLI